MSWGFAFRRPLCTCAGSSSECSQMELAPLLAKVCTICRGQAGPSGHGGSQWPSPHIPASPARTWSRVAGQGLWRRCLTMEMWRPRLRCTLQHSSQMSTPRLMDAQPGSAGGMGVSAGVPSPCGPLLMPPSSRGDALPQQPFPRRWRGAQPITRGNPRVSHSNRQTKGGAGFGPPPSGGQLVAGMIPADSDQGHPGSVRGHSAPEPLAGCLGGPVRGSVPHHGWAPPVHGLLHRVATSSAASAPQRSQPTGHPSSGAGATAPHAAVPWQPRRWPRPALPDWSPLCPRWEQRAV